MPSEKLKVDEGAINQRLQQLSDQRSSSRYSKQKTSLEREFVKFLASLSVPKSFATALPADVIAFLVWKDRGGKTKVHQASCPSRSSQKTCDCPNRLAFGTIDSLIGKLRAIFSNADRGSEWHPLLGVGNPAACRSVRLYLADVREEQLKARITPRQAEPFILSDLAVISSHIDQLLLNSSTLSPSQIYIYARDQALFKGLFFAGDRAADFLQLRVADVLRFPDNSGLLFNHLWTKSLRSGDSNVFAFKRGSNKLVCPVRGLEIYFRISELLGLKFDAQSFIFRSLSKQNTVTVLQLQSAAAQARLNVYTSFLNGQLSSDNFTIHGFRSGAAVSLALEGVNLHEIMDHVGWKSSKTALHYIKLKQVVNPAGAAAKLADLPLNTGVAYKRLDSLKGFSQAFN